MRSWTLALRGFGPERSRTRRPIHLRGFEISEQQQARLLLLGRKGAPSRLTDPVGGGDQQPVRELRPRGLREERVHVGLGDAVVRVIRLGLDRPQATLTILDNQVDPSVGPPPAWPLVPKPHAPDLVLVKRIAGQKPLADSLELPASPTLVLVQPSQQVAQVPHQRQGYDTVPLVLRSTRRARR